MVEFSRMKFYTSLIINTLRETLDANPSAVRLVALNNIKMSQLAQLTGIKIKPVGCANKLMFSAISATLSIPPRTCKAPQAPFAVGTPREPSVPNGGCKGRQGASGSVRGGDTT